MPVSRALVALLAALALAAPAQAEDWRGGGPADPGIGAVVRDPSTADRVYALSIAGNGAVLRSDDAGGHFRALGAPPALPASLAVDPRDPLRIALVGGGELAYSQDGGASWRRTGVPAVPDATAIVADPRGGPSQLLVSGGERLLRGTSPSGLAPAGAGLPDRGAFIGRLLVASGRAGVVYAVLGEELFRSVDAGASWRPTDEPPVGTLSELVVAPSDADRLLAIGIEGAAISRDGGASWQRGGSGLPKESIERLTTLAVDPGNADRAWLAADSHVELTLDGGRTWKRFDGGLRGPRDSAILVAVSSDVLLRIADGKLVRSTDGGASYRSIVQGLPAAAVYSVLGLPGGRLLAGGMAAVFSSGDGGASWSGPRAIDRGGPPRAAVLALAADPVHAGRAWAGIERNGAARSDDGGRSWHAERRGLGFTTVWSLATFGSTLWAASDRGVYRRAGRRWLRRSEGLPRYPVRTVVADGAKRRLLAGLERVGLWASDDGGRGWRRLGLARETVLAVARDPVRRATLLVVTLAHGVLRSADGGRSWRRVLPSSRSGSLAVDGEALVLATGTRVLRSRDGGRTWTWFTSGLPGSAVSGRRRVATALTALPGGGLALGSYIGAFTSTGSGT